MRFKFGENWLAYSQVALTEERVEQGRRDFARLFSSVPLADRSFLDIGFGQGLALCYASEAGAQAIGLDVDTDNLQALNNTRRWFDLSQEPKVVIASILDEKTVAELKSAGPFDVVHSWGVLHHTGDMQRAFANALQLVAEGGYFVVAIYRRHWSSPAWKFIKWLYNLAPRFSKRIIIWVAYRVIYAAKFLVTGKNPKRKQRGMNFYYDVVDWVGGYPYEYASEEEVIDLVTSKGLKLVELFPAAVPTGCNEFVFKKVHENKQA